MSKHKDTRAMDSLLRDAIADAKMVKEAAIANAMLTLKESFKPQLSSMLAAKLRNEEEDFGDDIEDIDEQKTLDSSDIGGNGITVDEPAPKKPSASASSTSDIDNPDQEVKTFGEGIEEDHFDDEDDLGLDNDDADLGSPDDEIDMGGEEDNLDLEAIIRDLEADLAGGDEGDEFGNDIENEGFDDVRAGQEVDGPIKVQRETLEGTGDEGVHKDGKEIPAVGGVNGGKEVSPGQKVTEGLDTEEINLDEILREMEADDVAMTSEKIALENADLKRSLREHREVIKLLRNRINEVTLLNNKLLYTTKIFRNINLSEAQKRKVVEQFDRANTPREAKIVYSTIAESFGAGIPKKVPVKITEGASKTVASTKSKSQTVITEGDAAVQRLQKLAGIIR